MSEMTVKDFAAKVGREVPRLLEQMKEAGLEHKSEADAVSEAACTEFAKGFKWHPKTVSTI